jgi:hypothetical protein
MSKNAAKTQPTNEKKSEKKEDPSNLVKIAVKFLQNPNIEKSSTETKRAFLKKKGESLFLPLLWEEGIVLYRVNVVLCHELYHIYQLEL